MAEARVVPDDETAIVEAVNACRARHSYVFTTGGIGPTHDDITAACVAKAFGRRYERNREAERRLLAYYPPERVNEARMSMADMPEGAELIDNPISVAPGFRLENVYVLPGVPKIMQAMLDGLLPRLRGGAKVLSRAITVLAPRATWRRPGSATFRPASPRWRSAAIRSGVRRGRGRRSCSAARIRRRSTLRPRRCWSLPPSSAPTRARTRRAADLLS